MTSHMYTYIEITDEFTEDTASLGSAETDDYSLGLLEHERHVAHDIGETGKVVDGHSNVTCPSTQCTPQALYFCRVFISILQGRGEY